MDFTELDLFRYDSQIVLDLLRLPCYSVIMMNAIQILRDAQDDVNGEILYLELKDKIVPSKLQRANERLDHAIQYLLETKSWR